MGGFELPQLLVALAVVIMILGTRQLPGGLAKPRHRRGRSPTDHAHWWDRRDRFELLISQAVLDEASRGDADAAARRMALLAEIPVLTVSDEVLEFAGQLLHGGVVPAKAHSDALHIAVAAVNRIAYLVTWNCTHIANAAVRGKIDGACRSAGLQAPIICTPEELMEA